uniref:Putative capsid protein n=1 Tax=viral metagenome TaxID=1070528 RepID=A0A6M3KLD0_9ZZZZ
MAWPTTRQPTDALTGQLVPQVWSAKVLDHTRSSLFADQVVSTEWAAMMTMGDYIYIPLMLELTGAAVDPSGDSAITNLKTAITDTAVGITIDIWWEIPVAVDDSVARQTQVPGLLEKAANNAAYGWKKKLDGDTAALFSSLTSTWAGSDGQTFTDDLLLDIMEGLDEADIPTERALVCDPSTIADLRKIDKFMSFDYSTNPLRLAGYRGMIDPYGLPVYMTNNLTAPASAGNYGAVLHKEAIGLAVQSPMDVEKWREPRRHSWIINTSGFFGVDVLRATFGAYFYTRKK